MPDLVFATKGQAAALRAHEDMKRAAKELQAEERKLAQEADKAKNAILKIYESTKTPQEQMKQRMDVLRKAIKDGTAPPEAMVALERLKAKYQETYSAARKEITSSDAKLKSLTATQKKSFDPSLVMTWGTALKTAVTAAIVASFKTVSDERAKLAEDSKSAITGEGQLAQFAETDEQMNALLAEARAAHALGVGRTRGEAANALASMVGADISDPQDRLMLMRMQASGLVTNAGDVAKSARTMQATFGGPLLPQLDRAFGAGKIAPGGAPELMINAASSALSARRLGMLPDEVLAGTAALSAATGSESEAATLFDALLRSLDKAGGFKGKSLNQVINEITARVEAGEDIRGDTLLGGRAEAVKAYDFFAGEEGRELYKQALIGSYQGVQNQIALSSLRRAESADPNLAAARFAISQEQTRNMRRMEEATFTNVLTGLQQAELSRVDTLPSLLQPFGRAITGAQQTIELLGDPESIARQRAGGALTFDKESSIEARKLIESIDQQREIQKRQEELMKKQLRAMESLDAKSNDGGLLIGGD